MLAFVGVFLLLGSLENPAPSFPQSTPPAAAAATTATAPAGTTAHATATQTPGQAAADSLVSEPTPADPKERLRLAMQRNGLAGNGLKPWHLKADYEVFDVNGKSATTGTFEAWWVSDTKYKLAYAGAGFSQEEYGTDHGLFHAGGTGWPVGPQARLRAVLLDPLALKQDLQSLELSNLERDFGSVKLLCTALLTPGVKQRMGPSPSFCFWPTGDTLRYANSAGDAQQSYFDHVAVFQGRFVARQVRVMLLGRPWLTVHVSAVEGLSVEEEAKLAPPANATAVTPRASAGQCSEVATRKVAPVYPPGAKIQGVQGAVSVAAIVDTSGKVHEVRALGGPQMLQPAAMDAARQWTFSPCTVDGKPAEMETYLTLYFNMGAR